MLKALNTNTLDFHQYLKVKLSSRQPSHITTPDTEQLVILLLHFLITQKLKNVIGTR